MRPSSPALPIVTLTTDFGLTDSYVAEIKAVLLTQCPELRIVDVTHQIPPQQILPASFTLERVLRAFPAGTIHVVVVDPGVGTDRPILLARIADQHVICPDNGTITWPWHRLPHADSVQQITYRPASPGATFHGRDIMAPVAAKLAAGEATTHLIGPMHSPRLLNVQPAKNLTEAVILHIDHFGNATTNLAAELVQTDPTLIVKIGEATIGPVRQTYGDVPEGERLALINSAGLLEIAVRNGSAARHLYLKPGDPIQLTSDVIPEP